jgi:hypothetical protein
MTEVVTTTDPAVTVLGPSERQPSAAEANRELIEVRDFTIGGLVRWMDRGGDRYDGAGIDYRSDIVERPQPQNDDGAILVRLNMDGEPFDTVTMDIGMTGDLEALDRAIVGLTRTRNHLARLYGDQPRCVGRCLGHGDSGRCSLRFGHEGVHQTANEEEGMADIDALAAALAHRAAS